MNKAFKVAASVIATILFVALIFYFWGSSGWVEEDYNQIKTYGGEKASKDTLTVMTYNLGYMSGMTNNLPIE